MISITPSDTNCIRQRFRGFLPVVVDVETAGFDAQKNALIEIAAMTLAMTPEGQVYPDFAVQTNVLPFEGAQLDKSALKFIGVEDPFHPFRYALPEKEALQKCFQPIFKQLKSTGCTRAILVGHNAFFDLSFLKAAAARHRLKMPFHQFSTLDTVSLSALFYGQTVLAKAAAKAGIHWDDTQAHSAAYDTNQTAELFCTLVNQAPWPPSEPPEAPSPDTSNPKRVQP